VVARTDHGDQPYLAGYAVLDEDVSHPTAERAARERITARLARLLPDYLVPRAWVFLDTLPKSASGKVDRLALPRPDFSADAADAPPATPMEHRLHELWAAELGVERIAVERSFFELGGHSLNAVRLLNRIRAELGFELSALEFYRTPTIKATAARLTAAEPAAVPASENRVRGAL
jgi:acyl carrier protein